MYRDQRHIYDLTRKFYLLGRDSLQGPHLGLDRALVVRCIDHRDLVQEVELNPVIVHRAGEGYSIVDALLTVAPAENVSR